MNDLNITGSNNAKKTLSVSTLQKLRSSVKGTMLYPGEEEYEQARRIWNGMIDRRPGLIVQCADTADVVRTVRFARENDLRLTVRGGGHNVAGAALSDGSILLDLSHMRSAVYDPVDNTLQVQGGARLGDIDHETYPFGRAVPVGVVSETGIGGLALHGGMGWLMRRYGLTVDNLVEADLVSSNGELLRASPDSHPDLFWALKGGGGNFGVVTSFRFRTRPVERTVWFVTVMYPLEQSVKVLRFWRDYMTGAPEDLASIATFWTVPDDPAVDPGPRGKPTLIILACCSGPADQGEKAVEPLRHIGTPIADLSEPMPFVEAQKALDADYPDGRLYYWKSMYLKGIDDAMIEALTERAARRPSLLTSLDIWALGGAYGGVDADTTPFVYRKAPFIFNIESNWEEPERSEENVAWSRELFKDMERYSTGGVYLNFPGMVEEGAGQMKAAYGRNHDRLLDIKRRYDPDNLFRGNLVV